MAYPIVDTILGQTDTDLCAAEAHGMAAGMLCVDSRTTSNQWLSELLHEGSAVADEAQQQVLVRLFDETRRLLLSDGFEFDLFLPDDDLLLSEQVVALKSWCQGFLFGIGSAHPASRVSAETREILNDISEFTRLDTAAEGNEDENAFTEITEYLRSAVLLLRDEFSSQKNSNRIH
ncbi:MAG: UPF0149 family protein [Methylovulum sp.]|nr:UPF0149 family protein [Methylovulum sp.]